jgi:hypothetical protein
MVRSYLALLPAVAALSAAVPLGHRAVESAETPRRIECHCRANGRNYELGARICLRSAAGYRLAECRMQQNVTSWMFGQEDCSPTAGRPGEPGTRTAALALTRR